MKKPSAYFIYKIVKTSCLDPKCINSPSTKINLFLLLLLRIDNFEQKNFGNSSDFETDLNQCYLKKVLVFW